MELEINELYREHAKYVYNVAFRMLLNKGDAEDVTQDVFIKLQDKLGTFKGNSHIRTFIYRMTINRSIDLIKRDQSQSSRAEKSWQPGGIKTGEIRINEDGMVLDSLLAKLSLKQRALVVLYEIAGCPQKEIAAAFGMSVGTVKSIISRAIQKMSQSLKEEG